MVAMRRAIPALASAMLLAGCDLGSTTIPVSDPQVVVHAILNPTLATQTFLLEESLTGKKVQFTGFDPSNPITATNGVPIGGAVIQLSGPEGVRSAGEVRSGGRATGVYQITGSVQPGAQYTVTISAIGRTVTGRTVVPQATLPPTTPVVAYNRNRESVDVTIPDIDRARAYWLRIEAPVAAFMVFTTDRDISISGNTRNVFSDDLLRVFFPGFRQTMTVAAVDTNVYDYYRSGNDPFSGVGLINHLEGGIGVFGSIAPLERRILDVTQDPTGDPIEGVFTLRGGAPDNVLPQRLQFYVEAKAASAEGEDRLSGSYVRDSGFATESGAFVGTRAGGAIVLDVYAPQSTTEIFYRVAGKFLADTLRMPFNKTTAIYVRQGK
jgi:hypothetical protein